MSVEGIGFEGYIKNLNELGIEVVIKTDNDIKKIDGKNKVSLLGIRRCQKLFAILENQEVWEEQLAKPYEYSTSLDYKLNKNELKIDIYNKFKSEIKKWNDNCIFLSEIELEEDFKICSSRTTFDEPFYEKDLVTYLQEAKKKNMNEYVNNHLNTDIAKEIFENERFACLKRLVWG